MFKFIFISCLSLLSFTSPSLAQSYFGCQKSFSPPKPEEIWPSLLSKLSRFPNLQGTFLKSQNIFTSDLLCLFREVLLLKNLEFIPLTPELRKSLQLPDQFNAAVYPPDKLVVQRMPLESENDKTVDDLIPKGALNSIDPNNFTIVAPDAPTSTSSATNQLAWSLQKMVHEMGHANFHLILASRVQYLSTKLPTRLFRKTSEGFEMHRQLYYYLHEWYAYRMGFKAMLLFFRQNASNPQISLPVSFGQVTYQIRLDNFETISKTIAQRFYGISDVEVKTVVTDDFLDKVIQGYEN